MIFSDLNIKINPSGGIQQKVTCPKCSGDRKNKRDRCLSVNTQEKTYNCHHCGWSGRLKDKYFNQPAVTYLLPKLKPVEVSNKMLLYFNDTRGISTPVLKRNKITESKQFIPGSAKEMNCIAFPYYKNTKLVNVKYRDGNKNFKMESGAEMVFYKLDDIVDEVIITEGEFDALSFEEAGFKNAVSVPNGASKGNNNLTYLDNCWEHFEEVKRIFLALDTDEPGIKLREELARRLGKDRCYIVHYEGECKDANEALTKHGVDSLKKSIINSEPYPIDGVFTALSYKDSIVDIYHNGRSTGLQLGMGSLDDHISFAEGLLYVFTGIPAHGKALDINTPIPTINGWKNMEYIEVGDVLFDEKGNTCNVINTTEVMKDRPCYKITFSDGTEIIADEDHQWVTSTWKSRRSLANAQKNNRVNKRDLKLRGVDQTNKRTLDSIQTTKDIFKTRTTKNDNRNNHAIHVCEPLIMQNIKLEIDPYVLGCWLGDGTSADGNFTCADQEIIDKITSKGYTVSKQKRDVGYCIRKIKPFLRDLNLLKNKHIPIDFLRGSILQRQELLRGLMDTDGYIDTRGTCEFTSTNYRLSLGAYDLICGLGMRAKRMVGDAKLNGKIVSKKYRIQFTPNFNPFHLPRKAHRVRDDYMWSRLKNRFVIGCEKIDSVPVKCIEVDSESHLFLCSESYIATHNSNFMNMLEISLARDHGWKFAVFSPEHGIDSLIIRYIEIYTGKPFYKGDRMTPDHINEALEFLNQHFCFIEPVDDSFDLDTILDIAKQMVKRRGINALILDPWNTISHEFKGMTETQYIERALSKLVIFKKAYNASVFLVAHTRKIQKDKQTQQYDVPVLYDINGSSNFYNKADFGITVYRDFNHNHVEIHIQKVKWKHLGKEGLALFNYEFASGRYIPKQEL